MEMDLVKLSKKGQLSIPRAILRRLNIQDETPMLIDVTPDGVIQLRQVAIMPIEIYSDARIAEFDRENQATEAEVEAVRKRTASRKRR